MLVAILAVAVAVLGLSTLALATYAVRVRGQKHGRGLLRKWPVPEVAPGDFDQRFAPGELGYRQETEAAFIAGGGISDLETWVLANLAKTAASIFEFGTATGKTTYVLARNAPPEATVVTLTLHPGQVGTYQPGQGDSADAKATALLESRFERFYYEGTAVEAKITQLYGDSKAFDESAYERACDLIFVDGSHAYSYVMSDSRKALRMIRPGGIILWHDYRGPRRTRGVFRALNELRRELPLKRLKGTSLVAYRQPG